MHNMMDKAMKNARPSKEHHDEEGDAKSKRRGSFLGKKAEAVRRGSMGGWWAHGGDHGHHDDHHGHHAGGERRLSVSGAATAVADFFKGHHGHHEGEGHSPDGHSPAVRRGSNVGHSPDAHGAARRGSCTGRRNSISSQIAQIVKLHHPDHHHGKHHGNKDDLNDAEHAPLLADRKAVSHNHYTRHTEIVDAQFLREADFRVPLTPHQIEHYNLIFDLNRDQSDENAVRDKLKVHDLAHFMETLGFPVPEEDLIQMINDLHITLTEGCIALPAFIEFMRRTLVADLPSNKIPKIHFLFQSEADKNAEAMVAAKDLSPAQRKARASKETMSAVKSRGARPSKEDMDGVAARRVSKDRTSKETAKDNGPKTIKKAQCSYMLEKLGFMLDELTINESFAEVDGDADGMITEGEFITQLGILKRNLLEVHQLEKSFTQFRQMSKAKAKAQRESADLAAALEQGRKNSISKLSLFSAKRRSSDTSMLNIDGVALEDQDEHALYASDLVAALGVTPEEAEEMIFVADLKENQSIDFTEFKQVVVNWSS